MTAGSMVHVRSVVSPENLVGDELSAVAFVRDYVEFHFDGPVLRALSDPLVRTDAGDEAQFPDPGSRDALCALIGRTVQAVRVASRQDSPTKDDRIEFDVNDATVVIPLGADRRVGPEAAHFIPSRPDGSLRLEGMRVW